jgi:hypothetical protein
MLDGDVELHDEQTILYLGMDWPDPPEGDDDEPEDDETGEGS